VSDDTTQTVPGILQTATQVNRNWAVQESLTIPAGAQGTTPTATQVTQNWAAQEVFGLAENALDESTRNNWSQPVLQSLDNKLSAFEQALNSFAWPTTSSSWSQARLVTGPDQAQGMVSGTVRLAGADVQSGQTDLSGPSGTATPLVKAFSGGFNATSRTTIAPGAYSFDLSLGTSSETLSVNVSSKDTWGGVLSNVQNAVNTGPLAARADVVYQSFPYQLNSTMADTGSALTLSVNPDRPDQNMQVADVSGSLLSQLGVTSAANPTEPATLAQYQVTGLQLAEPTTFSSTPVDPGAATTLARGRHDLAYAVGDQAQPSSYISKAFDPTQTTTLSAGTYTFTSTYGGETRSHSVTIGSNWTWGDVLRTVGAEVNAQPAWVNTASPTLAAPSTTYSQPGVSASVTPWSIPSATQQGAYTAGQSLQVTGAAGQSFTLADTSGGLLSALGLTTKLAGTPVSFNVNADDTWQDVFNNMAVAINSSQGSFTAQTVKTLVPSSVVPSQDLRLEAAYLSLTQVNQRIGTRVSLTDGGSGTLGSLGVTGRQQPGQDGEMTMNGQPQVSEDDTFSEDQGRVLLHLESAFPQTIPLSVTNGMDQVQQGWSNVTDAWNSLAKYLNNNSDLYDQSIGTTLEAPLKGQASNLRWLGVSNVGQKGQIWTNLDSFWSSISSDPSRAQDALTGSPAGLIPAWQSAVAGVRQAGLENWLKPATAFDTYRPTLTSEYQLEQKNRLINLLG